jgi:uncharacterized phage-associated protein
LFVISILALVVSTRLKPTLPLDELTMQHKQTLYRAVIGNSGAQVIAMQAGHDPRAVANEMIDYSLLRQRPISNVSIQKLMYFAHATFLIKENRPLISGAFEAWEFGPVSRPVYHELKQYGRDFVTRLISKKDLFSADECVPRIKNDIDALDQIAEVMRSMAHLHPNQLIRLSHVDGGAWSVVWNKSRTGATVGNIISDELIREKFGRLKVALPDDFDGGLVDEAAPFAGN